MKFVPHHVEREDYAGSLTPHDRRVVVAHRALDVLEDAVRVHAPTDEHMELLWECPRCRAAVGAPCVNRRTPGRSHAPRIDLMLRARCSVAKWCRTELAEGYAPANVMRTIRRHPLTKRLVKLGHLSVDARGAV